jgi:alkylation response protein AidB-like acyl-CoA dehydrogenase
MPGHEVLARIDDLLPQLSVDAAAAEQDVRLADATAKALRDTGIMRLLQPAEFGGYEAEPTVFFEAVMRVASVFGSAGWVCGIVGVHPWELALMPKQTQEEVWADDADTWISSSYLPAGRARKAPGGYVLNGRWQFSSGSDHCTWAWLGGLVTEDDGGQPVNPPVGLHFLLPRSDYSILPDTWNVVGLRATGSKDIVVDEVFVPDHHVIETVAVINPDARQGDLSPLYRLPWSTLFPHAITAALVGIAGGVLSTVLDRQRERAHPRLGRYRDDPHSGAAIGRAASDIDASRVHILHNIREAYEIVMRGEIVSMDARARTRRDQAAASWRAMAAVDDLFARSGGNAIRLDNNPLQRMWRDMHAGFNHVINVPGPPFHNFSAIAMGLDPVETIV